MSSPPPSALLETLAPASQLPRPIVRGEGGRLFDDEGKGYWDFYGGHAVCLLGQGHPGWVAALHRQAETLSFVTTLARLPIRDDAAAALAAFTKMDRVFFVNSGAEANEAALKAARKATGRERIVAMEGGFHGRTMACLGVTQAGSYRQQHRPLHGEASFVPYGDEAALAAALDQDVAAVLLEPIQGIAGAITPPPGFLTACRRLSREVGALLILDEVQTGIGRCGLPLRWHDEPACAPDLVSVGKSLGAGFPVAALLLSEALAKTTRPGEHGSTFGGGPMACAAVLAVLSAIENDGLLQKARGIGARFLALDLPGLVQVRGAGCLLGLVLDRPALPVAAALRERGFLVGSAADPHCVRLCPPATLPPRAVSALIKALGEVLANSDGAT